MASLLRPSRAGICPSSSITKLQSCALSSSVSAMSPAAMVDHLPFRCSCHGYLQVKVTGHGGCLDSLPRSWCLLSVGALSQAQFTTWIACGILRVMTTDPSPPNEDIAEAEFVALRDAGGVDLTALAGNVELQTVDGLDSIGTMEVYLFIEGHLDVKLLEAGNEPRTVGELRNLIRSRCE